MTGTGPKRPSILLDSGTLQLDSLQVDLAAQRSLDADLDQLRGDNMTSRTLGFGSDAVPITALVDSGSDMTFVSNHFRGRF